MKKSLTASSYAVGYGKLPKDCIPKKGKPSAQKGLRQPRVPLSDAETFRRLALQTVTIVENGETIKLPRLFGCFRAVRVSAVNGDPAAERLMQRVRSAFSSPEGEGEPTYLVIADREMKI